MLEQLCDPLPLVTFNTFIQDGKSLQLAFRWGKAVKDVHFLVLLIIYIYIERERERRESIFICIYIYMMFKIQYVQGFDSVFGVAPIGRKSIAVYHKVLCGSRLLKSHSHSQLDLFDMAGPWPPTTSSTREKELNFSVTEVVICLCVYT